MHGMSLKGSAMRVYVCMCVCVCVASTATTKVHRLETKQQFCLARQRLKHAWSRVRCAKRGGTPRRQRARARRELRAGQCVSSQDAHCRAPHSFAAAARAGRAAAALAGRAQRRRLALTLGPAPAVLALDAWPRPPPPATAHTTDLEPPPR
ncbi:MAG: hypothetical protein J3K34DRAFT_76513 [Monoraphidium minutum]|nr:MAG: hypothetical protein J3K34DRAFT_76513 [Monoraphidium minutum]